MDQQAINVLVGDASIDSSRIIAQALLSIPDVSIAAIVRSREMLIAKIRHVAVDLILIDPDSDDMGGVGLIDAIKGLWPGMAVIVVSDSITHDPAAAVTALEMGATDCLEKPGVSEGPKFGEFRLQMVTMIGLIRSRKVFARSKNTTGAPAGDRRLFSQPAAPPAGNPLNRATIQRPVMDGDGQIDIVVVASSTGGPGALVEILPRLPADLGVPVLVVQHMPVHMTSSFARSLDSKSAIQVVEALDGDEIVSSRVYVAPGGRHMAVSMMDQQRRRFIRLNDGPLENSVRPSADVLFRSVAESYGGNILAVMLTGMGEDGKKGVELMKKRGCVCLSQSSETCVVYGMPRAVDEAGLSDASLDLDLMSMKIVSLIKRGGRR